MRQTRPPGPWDLSALSRPTQEREWRPKSESLERDARSSELCGPCAASLGRNREAGVLRLIPSTQPTPATRPGFSADKRGRDKSDPHEQAEGRVHYDEDMIKFEQADISKKLKLAGVVAKSANDAFKDGVKTLTDRGLKNLWKAASFPLTPSSGDKRLRCTSRRTKQPRRRRKGRSAMLALAAIDPVIPIRAATALRDSIRGNNSLTPRRSRRSRELLRSSAPRRTRRTRFERLRRKKRRPGCSRRPSVTH